MDQRCNNERFMTEKKRSLFVEEKTLIVKLREVGPIGRCLPCGDCFMGF